MTQPLPEITPEALFPDLGTPLPAQVLGFEPEAHRLVEMSCSVQAREGPEKDLPVVPLVAEPHGRLEQFPPDALTPQVVRGDEPPQVSPLRGREGAVDGHGPVHFGCHGEPESIPFRCKRLAELREFGGDLGLEGKPEAGMPGVVLGMQL